MRWQIDLDVPLLTLNAERTQHWSRRASHTAEVREMAFWLTKERKIPRLDRAKIVAQPFQRRGPLADIGSHFPTVKAAVDGIVDAGVLPDDSPAHLIELTMHPPMLRTTTGLTVVVYAIGDASNEGEA